MATGDIRVIDHLVHDTMHTQHLPSGTNYYLHAMQNHTMFEYRLLHFCIVEVGFLSLFLVLCAGVFGTGRRQQYMSPPTTAAPHVRGHPPGDKGHGMQFAVCCCIY